MEVANKFCKKKKKKKRERERDSEMIILAGFGKRETVRRSSWLGLGRERQ